MNRTGWMLVSVSLLGLLGCRNAPREELAWPGEVNHVVICWLKDPKDAQVRLRLIEASNSFRAIPGVIGVHAGPRLDAAYVTSKAADNSFDVGVVITFINKGALLSYQIDPIHQQAVRAVLMPYVREYRTYDFLTQ